jgi:predicted transcriptional regulator
MGSAAKRSTVYLDAALHRVLRIKAAETDRSISALVNEAVKQSLAEDAEDLAAFEDRARERSVSFEKVLREMRRRGKL